MMEWIVKLTRHGGQYRITLPRELIVKAGLEDVKVVKLESVVAGGIVVRGYYGKWKEKRDIPEDKA